jgi:hypothetical protein
VCLPRRDFQLGHIDARLHIERRLLGAWDRSAQRQARSDGDVCVDFGVVDFEFGRAPCDFRVHVVLENGAVSEADFSLGAARNADVEPGSGAGRGLVGCIARRKREGWKRTCWR